jgi:membrane-associated protein
MVFSQASGIGIICTLLFLEEAGLPLPIAPGEAVLIGAGLLVARGSEPIWWVAPFAYLAVCCGVLVGYTWASRIGPARVRALAVRLHAGGPYDRAAIRLRAATPLQIAASRLLPGLRVYTSLVAGAVGLKLDRFMTGILPASALWVVAYIGLGYFVGAPLERLLGRLEAYGLRAVLVALVVLLWVLAARRLPAAEPASEGESSKREAPGEARWRVAAALGVDLSAVCILAGVLSLLAGIAEGNSGQLPFLIAILAIFGLLYLVVARQTVGYTLGEVLLGARYYPPRPLRLIRLR